MKKVGLVLRDRVVDAYAVPSLEGLVVYRSLYGRGLWMATHLPSKCSLGATGEPTRKGLVERLEKVQSFHPVDWSKSYDEMDKTLNAPASKFWRTFNSTRATQDLVSDDSWKKQ
jgi:hypothetical protein